MEERYIAAVDLGTSKIALSVAKVEGNNVQVIYYGEEPSNGIRNSYVYNPMKVGSPLGRCIDKAEKELGIKILQVVVGLPRYYVRQETAQGELPRTDVNSNITAEEIDNLKNMALDTYPLSDSEKEYIYGAVAQSFSTDDYHQILEGDVEGMVSSKFQGNFKVFVGSRKNVSDIDKIFNERGIAIAQKYFTPDPLAKIVLTGEEMDNGVALVDMGGGVTSVSVYKNGILRHYAAIPFGGRSITADIKNEGGFSMELAESIKLAFGACMPDKLASMSEKIICINYKDSGAEKQLSVRYLSEIITARVEEIIKAILYEIQMSGFANDLRSGVVLTGGCAELVNIGNLFKDLSGYNVRTGYPMHKFSSEGCNGVLEASATSVIGMLITAKNDNRSLNCLKEAPKMVGEDAAEAAEEENENIEDSVFDPDSWEKVSPEKKKPARKAPKPKREGRWKVISTIGGVFAPLVDTIGETFENLYQGMENEEGEQKEK